MERIYELIEEFEASKDNKRKRFAINKEMIRLAKNGEISDLVLGSAIVTYGFDFQKGKKDIGKLVNLLNDNPYQLAEYDYIEPSLRSNESSRRIKEIGLLSDCPITIDPDNNYRLTINFQDIVLRIFSSKYIQGIYSSDKNRTQPPGFVKYENKSTSLSGKPRLRFSKDDSSVELKNKMGRLNYSDFIYLGYEIVLQKLGINEFRSMSDIENYIEKTDLNRLFIK
ncbi:MAG: hypothetical protein ACLFUO_00525 [Candidatus Woesearchaeota archaeon]